jgi:hypothetical protein
MDVEMPEGADGDGPVITEVSWSVRPHFPEAAITLIRLDEVMLRVPETVSAPAWLMTPEKN